MVIKIEDTKEVIEFYRVPPKIGNSIIAILKEIADKESRVSYATCEKEDNGE